MTAEQKYGEVIKELGEVLHAKNDEIIIQKYQIDELTRLLKVAEEKIEKLQKGE